MIPIQTQEKRSPDKLTNHVLMQCESRAHTRCLDMVKYFAHDPSFRGYYRCNAIHYPLWAFEAGYPADVDGCDSHIAYEITPI